MTPTAIGKLVVEQAWRVLARARKIKDIVAEEKGLVGGTCRIGILPTIAPYLLPRFFNKMTADNPEVKFTVAEMKTADCKKALSRGEIDIAILVSLDDMENYEQTPLYYEQFMAYVSKSDALYANKLIKTSDLNDEFLWLLDEGHCFRDQLVKFCSLKSAQVSKNTYSLGSIETFMRMVEGGKGVTFIPELALEQLTDSQRQLVRPFAIPIPTRQVVALTTKSFVRLSQLRLVVDAVRKSVPECMLKMNNTEQRV